MLKYLLLAAVIQLVWGFTPSASKIVLQYLPVETYSAIRYTVSGLIFLAITLAKHRRLHLRKKDLPALATIGIFAYAFDSLGTLYGLKIGGVLNFALASCMNAVITAAVAVIVLKESIGRSFAVGIALSIVGGLLLVMGKYDLSNFQIAFGSIALIWCAYIFEALGFVYSRKYKERLPLPEYIAVLQISAGIFMWILSAALGHTLQPLYQMAAPGFAALTFVCLVSCCICYWLLYWLLNHIEGHRLAFFDCFHTLSAVAFGVILFHDPVNERMIIGGILLLSAVMVVSWGHYAKSRRTRAPSEESNSSSLT